MQIEIGGMMLGIGISKGGVMRRLGLVLMLLMIMATGCCEEGCTTTVTCYHSFFDTSYTETVNGCWATCSIPYEKGSQDTWCPAD